MRSRKLWIALGVAALLMFSGFWLAQSGKLQVTLNGEPVEGLAAAGAAGGGLLVAALAGVLALAFVAVMMLGTSVILAGVLACVLLTMLLAFAPFLLPGALAALALIWWWRRKDAKSAREGRDE